MTALLALAVEAVTAYDEALRATEHKPAPLDYLLRIEHGASVASVAYVRSLTAPTPAAGEK